MEKVGDYLWGQTVAASKADLVSDIKLCCARIEKLQARIRELEDGLRPFAGLPVPKNSKDYPVATVAVLTAHVHKAKELLK